MFTYQIFVTANVQTINTNLLFEGLVTKKLERKYCSHLLKISDVLVKYDEKCFIWL